MAVKYLTTPLAEADVRALRIGDEVTISGTVWGVRDGTLIYWQKSGEEMPPEIDGGVLLHTQPNVKKVDGRYQPTCVGTTTSQRMDRFTRPLLERHHVRAIIGKGGMSGDSASAMAEHGCVYLAVVGGAASVETLQVEEIEAVYWEHLMPECLWKFRFKNFGPLFVAIDATGSNLHEEVTQHARQRLAGMLQ